MLLVDRPGFIFNSDLKEEKNSSSCLNTKAGFRIKHINYNRAYW